MKNQNGFITLEIILATAIISLLAFVAVPKIDKIMDKILLDYEMKNFIGEVNSVRSMNRSSTFNPTIFYEKVSQPTTEIMLEINKTAGTWRLWSDAKRLGETRRLPSGMKINYSPDSIKRIRFNSNGVYSGDSGTVTLTSRRGKKAMIIFDSVGRWRGEKISD